jgi:hypothetical protein
MISTGEPETTASPKIIVPMADDAVVEVPAAPTTRPSTVFIDVPPVAVTSETAIPQPPEIPTQPAIAAPKKATPIVKPVVPVPTVKVPAVVPVQQAKQSIWDIYAVYLNYYGSTGYYPSSGYSSSSWDNDRDRDGGGRDGGRDGGGRNGGGR